MIGRINRGNRMAGAVLTAAVAVVSVGVVGMSGLMLTGCSSEPSVSDLAMVSSHPAQPVAILARVQGNNAKLAHATVQFVTSQAQLHKMGFPQELIDQLTINFDEDQVILLALGEQPTGGYWAKITGVQKENGKLYVQGLANRPGPDQKVAQHVTHPYSLVVIPNTGIKTLSGDIQSVTGQTMPEM